MRQINEQLLKMSGADVLSFRKKKKKIRRSKGWHVRGINSFQTIFRQHWTKKRICSSLLVVQIYCKFRVLMLLLIYSCCKVYWKVKVNFSARVAKMGSKYQVYTDFVSLSLPIVNLVFRFKFAAILFSVYKSILFCLTSNAFPDIGSVGRIEKKKLKQKYHKKCRNRKPWYPRMTLKVNIYICRFTKCTVWKVWTQESFQ